MIINNNNNDSNYNNNNDSNNNNKTLSAVIGALGIDALFIYLSIFFYFDDK